MSRWGYTATGLYSGTDARTRLGLRLATPAWLCVAAAVFLSRHPGSPQAARVQGACR